MTTTDLELTLVEGDRYEAFVTPDGYELVHSPGEVIQAAVFAEGIPGLKGDQGDPGPAGAGFDFVYEQNVAATSWVILHGLNGFPNVTLVDTLDRQFEGEIQYDSANQITVLLAIASTGRAFLS